MPTIILPMAIVYAFGDDLITSRLLTCLKVCTLCEIGGDLVRAFGDSRRNFAVTIAAIGMSNASSLMARRLILPSGTLNAHVLWVADTRPHGFAAVTMDRTTAFGPRWRAMPAIALDGNDHFLFVAFDGCLHLRQRSGVGHTCARCSELPWIQIDFREHTSLHERR